MGMKVAPWSDYRRPSAISKAPRGHGNRGRSLEQDIETSLKVYLSQRICFGEKVRETVVLDRDGTPRRVRSGGDFAGGIAGLPWRIEAKLTRIERLPLGNVKPHQIRWLSEASHCGCLGALLVSFSLREDFLVSVDWFLDQLWRDDDGRVLAERAGSVHLRRFRGGGPGCAPVPRCVGGVPLHFYEALRSFRDRGRPASPQLRDLLLTSGFRKMKLGGLP